MNRILMSVLAVAALIIIGCGKKYVARDKGKLYAEVKDENWDNVNQAELEVFRQNPNVKWVEILRKKEDPDVKEIVGHDSEAPEWARGQREKLDQAVPTP